MKHNPFDRLLRPYMTRSPTETQYLPLDALLTMARITKRQLDYYIKQGAVSRPIGRTSAARYTAKHLDQINRVVDLRRKGHSIKEIAEAYAQNIPGSSASKTKPRVGRTSPQTLIVHQLTEGIRVVVDEDLLPTEVTLLNQLLKLGKLSIERRAALANEAITRDDKVLNQEITNRRRKLASRR